VTILATQMANVRRGIAIEWLSVIWMVIEAGAAIGAGLMAHSIALIAFGADSIIELVAGVVLLWRLYVESSGARDDRVKRAEKVASWVVGIALLLLAVYIVASAAHDLWTHQGAESSALGIALAVASGIIMPFLARAKVRIGGQIGSKALKADGACSIVCAYMAWTVMVGVVLTALFGWWWVDAVVALALVYFVVKEGIEAIQVGRGVVDACSCSCNSNCTAD
jgi:divalent metal cation (Fe/Co/Zn/Cd) transporter